MKNDYRPSNINKTLDKVFGEDRTPYENGFKDALESMAIAMYMHHAAIANTSIVDIMDTVLQAYENNSDALRFTNKQIDVDMALTEALETLQGTKP